MCIGGAALVGLDRGDGLVDPAAPIGRPGRVAEGKWVHRHDQAIPRKLTSI
jgi:hypothetical protein